MEAILHVTNMMQLADETNAQLHLKMFLSRRRQTH